MTDDTLDTIEFDAVVAMALADSATGESPRPEVRQRLMASLREPPPLRRGFAVNLATSDEWVPHPVPGIRMRVLSMNRKAGYATLLLDVAPGARFPCHHHSADEECYVISGSLFAEGRRIEAGDFLHADAGTDHGELWTEEGCRVLLVVQPEDYMPAPAY